MTPIFFLEQLPSVLKKAFSFGERHILGCVLCSGKGFVCELCGRMPPIYPFHLEDISQCRHCFNVFHRACSDKLPRLNCPRCERKEARNLNWHISNVRCRRERRAMLSDEDSGGEEEFKDAKSAKEEEDVPLAPT